MRPAATAAMKLKDTRTADLMCNTQSDGPMQNTFHFIHISKGRGGNHSVPLKKNYQIFASFFRAENTTDFFLKKNLVARENILIDSFIEGKKG